MFTSAPQYQSIVCGYVDLLLVFLLVCSYDEGRGKDRASCSCRRSRAHAGRTPGRGSEPSFLPVQQCRRGHHRPRGSARRAGRPVAASNLSEKLKASQPATDRLCTYMKDGADAAVRQEWAQVERHRAHDNHDHRLPTVSTGNLSDSSHRHHKQRSGRLHVTLRRSSGDRRRELQLRC